MCDGLRVKFVNMPMKNECKRHAGSTPEDVQLHYSAPSRKEEAARLRVVGCSTRNLDDATPAFDYSQKSSSSSVMLNSLSIQPSLPPSTTP
ncbi:hypothetical protein MHYP_G00151410 [Metynnis hypsauchen]